MSEGFIETLETKIDTNKNLKLEEQEILDFIKQEENLQALGKELQNICHQSPDRLGNFGKSIKSICEKILQKGGESIDQIRILMFFKEYAGKQFPDINKQIQTFINRKHLEQEIDQATTEALQNSINNLKELGIDTHIIPNWTLLFQTIKHPQDLSNITLENLKNFLPLPNTVIPENLPYILANFQEIIAEHLHINPGYLSFIGNNGRATGTSLEQTSKGNQYRKTILHNIESIHRKKNLQEKIAYALKSGDIFELWLKKEISSLKGEAQIQAKISKIFTILDDQQTEILLSFMHNKEKNDSKSFLGGLKEVLFHTYLEKKNAYTTTIEKEQILTPEGIDILTPLLKKYGSKAFESLVENSKIINTFYTEAEKLGFSRAIARNDIINLYSKSQATIQEINKLEEDLTKTKNERNKYFYPTTSYGVSTRTIQDGVDGSITAKKKHELMVTLAEEYTSVLLKDPNNKGKKITAPGVFGGFTLDFSKGNSPQTIVRDSFGEKITDQRDLFVDNLKNDKQAAFGSLCGMVGGCTLAGASVFSGNIWATSAGFTAGLKIGNGLGQEVWNGGEYLYTKRGGSLEGTYNQVDKFGNSFLRGIGSHEFKRDQNGNLIKDHNGKIEQEFIGWDRLAMNLGFDYLSTLATFGLSQKFKGMISQIAQVKGIGQGLKFCFEELVLENFFVDIPMNIVQTGVDTLTGIDTDIKTGQTALGTKEGTPTHTSYQSNSLSDMLSAMKEAREENLSFENLSQTFFSTIIYGGLLEGGGVAINKIKTHLPAGQIAEYQQSERAAIHALSTLRAFIEDNGISFNNHEKCIDKKTQHPLNETDLRIKKFMNLLKSVQNTQIKSIETLENLSRSQNAMLQDSRSKNGLLFKLGLISAKNTPLNILEKKIELCLRKIDKATEKGDYKRTGQLKALKERYHQAKRILQQATLKINHNQESGNTQTVQLSFESEGKLSIIGGANRESQQDKNKKIIDKLEEINSTKGLPTIHYNISQLSGYQLDDIPSIETLQEIYKYENSNSFILNDLVRRSQLIENKQLLNNIKWEAENGYISIEIQYPTSLKHIKYPTYSKRLLFEPSKENILFINSLHTSFGVLNSKGESFKNFYKVHDGYFWSLNKLQNLFEKFYDSEKGEFRETWDKYETFIHKVANHPIPGIKNLQEYIIENLVLQNPDQIDLTTFDQQFSKIELIYQKNHLPEFYKKILVHDLIHPTYTRASNATQKGELYNKVLIFKDILKAAQSSNNLNLKTYLNNLITLKATCKQIEAGRELSPETYRDFQEQMQMLFMIGHRRNQTDLPSLTNQSPSDLIALAKENLGAKQGDSRSLFTILEAKVLGGMSCEELLHGMQHNTKAISELHESYAQGDYIQLPDGDFWVKGINSQFFENNWDNGFLAPEFTGSETQEATVLSKQSDNSPYDTDGVIIPKEQGLEAISQRAYGDGLYLISIQDERFISAQNRQSLGYSDKYEQIRGRDPYGYVFAGIRHGFGSSMVDALLINEESKAYNKLNQIKYTIAKQGFYTPIINKEGKILFSKDEYKTMRQSLFATIYSQGEEFQLTKSWENSPYQDQILNMQEVGGESMQQSKELKTRIKGKIQRIGFDIADYKGDKTKVLINEIGSTARGSDLGGEADFDYLIRLPLIKGNEIINWANEIAKQFSAENSSIEALGNNGIRYYQMRLFGVETPQGKIDLDIGVGLNDSVVETDPDVILANKYQHIKETQGEQALQTTLANIKRAKKILKEKECYKKGTHGQGGLGGIGVENWILQHNGDALQAFISFYQEAFPNGKKTPISFEEFSTKYKVLGVGNNARSGEGYENFIIQNMTTEGYLKMAHLAEEIYENKL